MAPPLGPPGPAGNIIGTAVIAGTATAVSGRVARKQQAKFAEQDAAREQQPAPDESAAPLPDYIVELEKLAELKAAGVLTEEDFEAKKKQILGI
jgi:Short C-terminal domain